MGWTEPTITPPRGCSQLPLFYAFELEDERRCFLWNAPECVYIHYTDGGRSGGDECGVSETALSLCRPKSGRSRRYIPRFFNYTGRGENRAAALTLTNKLLVTTVQVGLPTSASEVGLPNWYSTRYGMVPDARLLSLGTSEFG